MNELSRLKIAELSEKALLISDVAGVFPTPLEEIRRVTGITELLDISNLPADITVRRPNPFKRILGAYLFRSETALVDLSQPDARARFTEGHEIGHKMIPWHRETYYTDDDTTLAPDTRELLEQEANYASARLLFQGRRFHERALQYESSIKTPIKLASGTGASMHATIWYYVEHHPDPTALIVTGLYGQNLPVWNYIYSPSFCARYGGLEDEFRGEWLPLGENSAYAEVAAAALSTSEVFEVEITLRDLRDTERSFRLEAFSNQRSLFLMLSPRAPLRAGRRLHIVTTGRER